MSDFFDTTIGEQLTLQRGFDITKKQQMPGDVPVVSSGGVASYHNEAKVEGLGVVLGRKGTLGTVFYIEDDYWPHDTSLWVKDFKGNNPRFVYYFFKSITSIIKKMDVGAANPALNRNHVHPMEVKWPVREVQDYIVGILATLDDKIQLNRQTNQTLEAIAQAIFKSWFVDFDPTRAKIAANECAQARAAGASTEELIEQLLEDGRWTTNQAQTIAQGDPELAAMSAISGQFISAETNKEHQTHEQNSQLTPEKLEVLRQTAALFPSALVDSELGEIPEGWGKSALKSWGEIVCGKTPSKKKIEYYGGGIPFIKIPDMHGNTYSVETIDSLTKEGAATQIKKLLPEGSVCVSCIATVGEVLITSQASFTNQQINSIIPSQKSYLAYLYFSMLELKGLLNDLASGGSATLNLNTGNFSRIELTRPSDEVLESFTHIVKPLLDSILEKTRQIVVLTTLRDSLLPKLLSGDLDV